MKREKTRVNVVPTAGKSFEADMAERDKTADTFREIAAMGGDITVGLHADLDDEEMRRVIKRYAGMAAKFALAEHDSTAEARDNFRRRWRAAGGTELGKSAASDPSPVASPDGPSDRAGSAKGSESGVKTYYWIAINGPSCTMSSVPLPTTISVKPVPELLLGFESAEEAQETQNLVLTASIDQCRKRLDELARRAKRGEIMGIAPSHPEPPTAGPTSWNVSPTVGRSQNDGRQK